jgi:hypothetical protein
MKNKAFFLAITITVIACHSVIAQVKIGSNPTTINTGVNLEVEATNGTWLWVNQADGKVGIGTTTTPTNQLHVVSTVDPLRLQGLQAGASSDSYLTADATGVVHSVSATKPQIVTVQLVTATPVSRGTNGTAYHFTNYGTVVNTVIGATIAANGDITVPAGTYQVTITVEGGVPSDTSPPAAGFYILSYYYDFANSAAGAVRIHQNQATALSPLSNHGICITYITVLTTSGTFPFQIGWGQSGNATSTATINFAAYSTQLSVTKIL